MYYHAIRIMTTAITSMPANRPEKKPARIGPGGVEVGSLSAVSSWMQALLVMSLSGVGHCLLSTIGVPSTTKEGLSSASSHVWSTLTSVLAVIVPSGLEYRRSAVRWAVLPEMLQLSCTPSMALGLTSQDRQRELRRKLSAVFRTAICWSW